MRNFIRKTLKLFGYILLAFILILGITYVYLASQIGEKADEKAIFKKNNSSVLVFAHRGGGGLYPENTLEAFKFSADLGVDVLELDVHLTTDGKLVVLHDSTVNRTTNGNGKVKELTLAELKNLDAGYQFSTDNGQTFPFRNKNIKIPTLEEIFDALPDKNFNIEPKQSEPSMIKPLCDTLRERKATERVIIGSFRQQVLDEFRQICPEVATSASPSEALKFLFYQKIGLAETYSPKMQALQVPESLGSFKAVTKDFVESAHKSNLQVHVWTINETVDMQRLIDIGVDGIMTDYPDRLLEITKQK
ncbi:MAG: glycerophosphodiester phosphodiesterase [Pyrinomonadaceae bacterium]|nr:glycerophosphodiester phosphodiesterase [Pyrinomonadaceae bacterium]